MKNKNVVSQKQFRGGYAPQQPVDPDNRSSRTEPNAPSRSRKRDSIQLGSQTQARPGLVGLSDYDRKPKRRK